MNVFVLLNLGNSSSGTPLTSIVFFSYYGIQWCPKTAWLQTFFKRSSFFIRQNKEIHTGLELLDYRIFICGWTIPLRHVTFKPLLQPKYGSCITLLLSIEKVILSESGEKYAQIKHRLEAKKIQNRGWTFHWRKRYYGLYFGQKIYGLKLKTLGCSFLLYKTTEQLMKLGIGDWCAIDEIINLPKSIPKKTQTHMLLEWPES